MTVLRRPRPNMSRRGSALAATATRPRSNSVRWNLFRPPTLRHISFGISFIRRASLKLRERSSPATSSPLRFSARPRARRALHRPGSCAWPIGPPDGAGRKASNTSPLWRPPNGSPRHPVRRPLPLADYVQVTFDPVEANGLNPNLSLSVNGLIMEDPYGETSNPSAAVNGNVFSTCWGNGSLTPCTAGSFTQPRSRPARPCQPIPSR